MNSLYFKSSHWLRVNERHNWKESHWIRWAIWWCIAWDIHQINDRDGSIWSERLRSNKIIASSPLIAHHLLLHLFNSKSQQPHSDIIDEMNMEMCRLQNIHCNFSWSYIQTKSTDLLKEREEKKSENVFQRRHTLCSARMSLSACVCVYVFEKCYLTATIERLPKRHIENIVMCAICLCKSLFYFTFSPLYPYTATSYSSLWTRIRVRFLRSFLIFPRNGCGCVRKNMIFWLL